MPNRNSGHARFGAFDVDLSTGELRKNGIRLRLQKQPFQLLALLLEKQGELVTREELKEGIWGSGTNVDFDHGLNKAVKKIREALSDSADEPKYIETLARRGYRFVAAVTWDPLYVKQQAEVANAAELSSVLAPVPSATPSARKWLYLLVVVAISLLAAGVLLREKLPQRELKQRQLTTNSAENLVESAILSPDGKYLLYGDQIGIHLRLIATGETHTFDKPDVLAGNIAWFPTAWFPDGARFVAVSQKLRPNGTVVSSSWIITVLGGAIGLLRDDAFAHAVAPDGSRIAFTSGNLDSVKPPHPYSGGGDIWIMGSRGEDAQRIVAGDDSNSFDLIQWSPTGRRVLYLRTHFGVKPGVSMWSLESRDLKGGGVTVIVPDLYGRAGFCWLPDGRIIYSVDLRSVHNENTNLWEVRADPTTGELRGQPRRLTNWVGIHTDRFSFSADGRLMVMQKWSGQLDVYVGGLEPAGRLRDPQRLTLEDSDDVPLAWTPDSKSVIFVSNRTGTFKIYRQALDQLLAKPITTDADENLMVRVSPDGRWILYMSRTKGETHSRLMRMPVSGGAPHLIAETAGYISVGCPISSGTECIMFEPSPDRKQTVLSSFDPEGGKHRELFRIDASERGPLCSISSDGSQFACLLRSSQEGRIQFLSLTGQIKREIQLEGWTDLNSLDWTPDGKMLVSSGGTGRATLLLVDLDGRVQPLWEQKTLQRTWGIASPNGHYVALLGKTDNSNAWLLENF